MIQHGEIPAHKVQGRYHFSRTELLEWAMVRKMNVSPELVNDEADRAGARLPRLSDALKPGGIFYRLESKDKKTALRSIVDVLRLPEDADRGLLLKMMLARETLASTSIGGGIAIPHVRNPLVLRVSEPQMILGFLKTPVDFQALDGKPVFALFSMITPNVRAHLHLLSRLAFALQDAGFKEVVFRQEGADIIMRELARVESSFVSGTGGKEGKAKT